MKTSTMSDDFQISHYEIDFDFLPVVLYVIVSPDAYELRKHQDAVAMFGEPAEDKGFAGCCSYQGSMFALWIACCTTDVVTHEVYHLVDNILETLHIPLSRDTCELRAYLFSWLYTEVINCIKSSQERDTSMS